MQGRSLHPVKLVDNGNTKTCSCLAAASHGPYFSNALTLVLYLTVFVCTEMITLASGVLTDNLTPVLALKESHEEYGRVS